MSVGINDFFRSNTTSVAEASNKSSTTSCVNIIESVAQAKNILDAEIFWCLKVITSHYSYKSNNDIGKLFSLMFPDSAIAKKFSCSERKVAYLCHFGLAPYFESLLYEEFSKVSHFTLLFDETLNTTTQQKQLDLLIRYWHEEERKVNVKYLTSVFMGHATASDIFQAFQESVKKLQLKKLLQISMDGPAVNWKFYEILQKELRKEYDIECICIGSCGLHIVNNSFHAGESYTEWEMSSILSSLYYLFKDSPARREDFLQISEKKKFPLKFCHCRWLENGPVSIRAFDIWQDIIQYVKAVESGRFSKVTCKSFITVAEATKDKVMLSKLLFFSCVAEILKSFLETYQSDAPLLPFFSTDIHKLVTRCLQNFKVLKEKCSNKVSSSLKELCDFDFSDTKAYNAIDKVSPGFRAEKVLIDLYTKKEITDKDLMTFKHSCQKFIIKMLEDIINKSPITYTFVRNAICISPIYMAENSGKCQAKMKQILTYLCQKNQIYEKDCDTILFEYADFLENVVKKESLDFKTFDYKKKRLDDFLHVYFEKDAYPNLWNVIKIVLVISHGQASIERGFSINKNIEIENLADFSYIAQRRIYDFVKHSGGIQSVNISKELRTSASSAHSKYKLYLEEQSARKIAANEVIKRKLECNNIASLKQQKCILEKEITELEKKANDFAQRAEKFKDFSLLTESNKLRKTINDKTKHLEEIDIQISECEKEKKKKLS